MKTDYSKMSTRDLARKLSTILNRNRKEKSMSDSKQVTPRFKNSKKPFKTAKKAPGKVTAGAKAFAKGVADAKKQEKKAPRVKKAGSNILKVLDAISHQKGEFTLKDIAESTGLEVKQVSGYVGENADKVRKGVYKQR